MNSSNKSQYTIAIVLKTFPPDVIGGMETQTKQMATELHKAGHNVTVFTKSFGEHDDNDVPYEVTRVRNWKLKSFISDFTFMIFTLFILIRRRKEFDVLQCMMIYPIGFLGHVVNRVTGLPYFAWIRGGDYYLMNNVWWKRWMMKRVLNDTLVLAQSKEIREDVASDFSNMDCNIEVLGNAVSIPDETASGEGVLYIGRLVPKKGIKYLIRAMKDVDTHLTIVGDGPERERLETLVSSLDVDVTFVGEVDPNEVNQYYRDAAVFALPSIEGEGMPNVILESMSWGLPVVATESGALPTLLDDGKTGYIVPMRDSDMLRDRMTELLNNPDRREAMGCAARKHVDKNHSWNWLITKLETVYANVKSQI